MLQQVLERGRSQGVFHRDVDALDMHMLISSFCFFRINNRYTFAANFGRNLVEKRRRAGYRRMIGDVVVGYLTTPARVGPASAQPAPSSCSWRPASTS